MPTRVSRSGIFNAQAVAYGQPPEYPRTAKRASASWSARDDIGGPVSYSPAGLELRAAEARPIWNNHADVEAVGQLLTTKQIPFEAAAGRAVEIKDWSSIRAAIFVIGEQTATWQSNVLVDLGHDFRQCEYRPGLAQRLAWPPTVEARADCFGGLLPLA
jgi:hypothetical protein